MPWFQETPEGVIVAVHACPRASKTAVQGLHGDALKIRLRAPPVDGRANEILVAFLAETLGVPVRQVSLVAGDTGRRKRVLVRGVGAAAVRARLLPGAAS